MRQCYISVILIAVILLAACTPNRATASPPPAIREDLPIFPGAEGLKDDTDRNYYYQISGEDASDIQRFYRKEMPDAGWEFLGAGDLSGDDIGEAYALWFSKEEETATVEIYPRDGTVYVLIRFE
ncbi:MAG TPA: hypothetical protein VJ785_11935 [Anaerolineales bacterium]|nr:hypothetical protein [Anaerolineales bacterium]